MKSFLNVSLFLLIFYFEQIITTKVRVCYYWPKMAIDRPGRGKFEVINIDPHLCTHLVYSMFYANVHGGIDIVYPKIDLDKGYIKKVNQLKKINPQLKTLAHVLTGGINPDAREKLGQEAKKFVLKHGFDGILSSMVIKDQTYSYDRYLESIKKEFTPARLILAAKVPNFIENEYDIEKMSRFVDQIHLEAFNFQTNFHKLGLIEPLYAGPADHSVKEKQQNVDAIVNRWLKNGAPKEKLVLGIPFFGYTFVMENSKNHSPGAASIGPGQPGPYLKSKGVLGYNEVCINQKKWKRFWEPKQQAPYAINENQWLSYEDVESIGVKIKYVTDKGLAGVMVSSIDFDDFQNDCGHGKYPLLNKIKSELRMRETYVMEDSKVEREEMISLIESSDDLIKRNMQPECPEGFKHSENLDIFKKISQDNNIIIFFEKYLQMSKTFYSEV